jgi:L-alanine-DL-glutamate epimerase-like enolase superfamily enzyme
MYRAVRPAFSELVGEPPVRSLADLQRAAGEVAERGYKALKTNLLDFETQSSANAVAQVARGRGPFELNIDRALLLTVEHQLGALRQGAGSDVPLMLDLNFNFKTEGFRQIAKQPKPSICSGLRWIATIPRPWR